MRTFAHSILILLSLLALASCSQKKSGVKLEISNNFVFGADSLTNISQGGLMVWGRSSSGQAFGQALEDSNQIRLQLDPGAWTFYAMAWDGATDYNGNPASNVIFGGKSRCAKSPVTKLESDAVSIDLVLDNNNCSDPAFAGSIGTDFTAGFHVLPKLKLNFCSEVGLGITSASQKCADTFNDPATVAGKGAVSSFRVTLRNFTGPASGRNLLAGGIKGECVPFTGDAEGGPETSALYGAALNMIPGLPAGGIGFPFHMTLEMYPGSTLCEDPGTGFRGVITKELINGATFELPGNNKYFATTGKHRQYVEVSPAKICASRSGTYADHPFAGGTGTVDSPYLICSVPQFYEINNATYMSKSFKLQANLDFNPYSNGLSVLTPALFSCLELGTNFLPIGITATCPTINWTPNVFTGSFFGSNFRLRNLRLRAEDQSYLGVFADFQGAHLNNLILENTEISGSSQVGALAGMISNNTYISNIEGKNLDIEARDSSILYSDVGSIFGIASFVTIEKIKVHESKVRGEASRIGGIAGYASNITASKLASEVDIEANSQAANQVQIGGVFGLLEGSNVSFLKHEGGIYTDATEVGGLIGTASQSSITDFYTISHIQSYDSISNSKIGGAFGYVTTTSVKTIGRGYSLSVVKTNCPTGCTQGPIVGNVAVVSPTYLPMYKLAAGETGQGSTPGGFGTNGTDEVVKTMVQLKSATSANLPDLLPATGWVHVAGEYPRFVFEQHPCLYSGHSGSGDGTLLNPIRICNENQYLALGNSSYDEKFVRLSGNIRLSNASTSASEITDFRAKLLGNNKAIIGGHSASSAPTQTGHIMNLYGSISNLKIHGMSRSSTYSSSMNPHGVFVANNYGLLQDITAWTYAFWNDYGSGFVGINKPSTSLVTGKIKNVVIDGIFKGQNNFTSLAVINEGDIVGSEASGELVCTAAGCTNIAGLVGVNTGSISKTSVKLRLSDTLNAAASASMLVNDNSTGATITDVDISSHANFRLKANGVGHYFHSSNDGTLTRVVNYGKMIDIDNTQSASISTPADAEVDTGTHIGVLRTGGRSGKLLLEGAPLTCNGTNLTISDWTNIVADVTLGDPAWESAFGSGLYTAFAASNKKLIAHVTLSDGTKFTEQITSYAGSDIFGIPTNYCASTVSGEVDLFYSNDIPVDALNDPLPGVILPQFAGVKANYLPLVIWNNHIWDVENSSADLDEMLAYFSYLLKVSPDPVVPKTWELDDEGIGLLEN